ncbi:MAG: GNAT family N-acetyltransferase [Acidimicrobiia bacterium]|nr:GNAT family N-acetyltransferase [Acidimicrobiia bacterium]
MADVELELINESNWQEALEVRVSDDQVPFVADCQPVALVILAKCFLRPDGRRWEPFLVRHSHGLVVGVLALTHGDGDSELRHVAIDAEQQGRGFGTSAVKAIIDRLRTHEVDCMELIVSAHPDNHAAHAVYRSAGLAWNGERRGIEPLWRLTIDRSDTSGR